MKILKNLEKKSVFNIIVRILFWVMLVSICLMLANNNIKHIEEDKAKIENYNIRQDQLLKIYKNQIDSIYLVNLELQEKQLEITKKIDSLNKRQEKINKEYGKKISDINNSSIYEHVNWVYSKIDSLKRIEISDN